MHGLKEKTKRLRAQSFTSLKSDLRQDINRGFTLKAGALMELFLEGNASLRPALVI